MLSYKESKKDALAKLKVLLKSHSDNVEDVIQEWKKFSKHSFFSFLHKINPAIIYPHIEKSDNYGFFDINLHNPAYIQKAWDERKYEYLGGETCFLIASARSASDFVFVNFDLSKGIGILNHEDTFISNNLDEDIMKEVSYFNCSIHKLISSCRERKQ